MRFFIGFLFIIILVALSVIQMRSKTDSARRDFVVVAIFALIALVAGSFAA
jgi:hypothetical protein